MNELDALVKAAREGDADAFAALVRRFQDMAVGYAYSMLRDLHLAEDAAQEAFFAAYRCLGQLREPAAFAAWFRRVVFKQCDRMIRRQTVPTVPFDGTGDQPRSASDPQPARELLDAIHALPHHERDTTLLFYISGYSMQEIGAFLDVPVSTIKGRLHSARNHLRAALLDSIGDTLRSHRPSRDESFTCAVVALLEAARAGDVDRVTELLRADPRLLVARDPMGNTALILAVNGGHRELAEILFEAGVTPGFHEAAAIGDIPRMHAALEGNRGLLDSQSPEGFPALALAAHFGQVVSVRWLLDRGADLNRVARHPLAVTPLHAALFGRQVDAARLLIERGADVNAERGGHGLPRAGWTPLHYAASVGLQELVELLLDRGADPSRCDAEGKAPAEVAVAAGAREIADTLRRRGAL